MTAGDEFEIGGYDLLAAANGVETGERVVVLGNNSTHYLVAAMDVTEFGYIDSHGVARFIASFPYNEDLRTPYRTALLTMIEEAEKR